MPSIDRIDENGAVVGQHELADDSGAGQDQHRSAAPGGDAPSWPVIGRAPRRRRAGARSPAPAPSSGGRRAPAGPAWARARSPHFTGGGVAFPPIPRSYAMKVNKKVRAQAFRMALGDLVAGGTVRVLSGAAFDEPSTKRAATILEQGRARHARCWCWWAPTRSTRSRASATWPAPGRSPSATPRCRTTSGRKSLLFTEAAVSFLEGGLS